MKDKELLEVEPHKRGHKFGEAFMLMWYECDCGHKELIWNSRDGVTPFGCGCPSCGSIMNHKHWCLDKYAPKYELLFGQRFWRDGTPDEAVTLIRKRIDFMRDKYPINPEQEEKLLADARSGECYEFQAGWPMLDIKA